MRNGQGSAFARKNFFSSVDGRGRTKKGPRRLGLERLEDRRVLSGLSLVAAPVPSNYGQLAPPAASAPAGHGPVSVAVSSAELAAETTVGQSINAFAESLYREIQSQQGGSGNLFLSPLSISTALAMTYAGARGETATQMASALHYTLDASTLAGDFGSLLTDLNSAGQGGYALSVADALWGQQGFPFLSSFLNLVQADYGGGLHQVDFAGATEATRQTINDWVAQETNNKIQNLIPEGALSPLTRLVLTNAVYFKGQWATAFDPSLTQDAAFTVGSGGQVQVPTMHATGSYGYMQSDGYQVLELPYQGNRLAMDVILPSSTSGPAGLDAGQLPADLSGWLRGLTPEQVIVSLPKFKMTTQFELSQSLESLGMTDAFSGSADFSGISQEGLKIDSVIHKAFIDVGETGTEAAAATAVSVTATCVGIISGMQPIAFNADHPFLFLIRDTQSGSVLFMGQVANPAANGGDSSAPAVPKATSLKPTTNPFSSLPGALYNPIGPLAPVQLLQKVASPGAPVRVVLPVAPSGGSPTGQTNQPSKPVPTSKSPSVSIFASPVSTAVTTPIGPVLPRLR
jgi:serpin B